MKQQLTTEQVKAVDDFVRENYIRYDDVRVELVDHIATEVEADMLNNPEDTFGKILWKIGHKYGPELKKLVKLKEKQLISYWIKRLGQELIKFSFSFYALIPIGWYFLMLGLSTQKAALWTVVLLFLLLVINVIKDKRQISWARKIQRTFGWDKGEDKANKFLVIKTYNIVTASAFAFFYPLFMLTKDNIEIGSYTISSPSISAAFLIAAILFALRCRSILDSYFDEHPLLAGQVKEFEKSNI